MSDKIWPVYLRDESALLSEKQGAITQLASIMGYVGGMYDRYAANIEIDIPVPSYTSTYWLETAEDIVYAVARALEAGSSDKEHLEADAVMLLREKILDAFATENTKIQALDSAMQDQDVEAALHYSTNAITESLKKRRANYRGSSEGLLEL